MRKNHFFYVVLMVIIFGVAVTFFVTGLDQLLHSSNTELGLDSSTTIVVDETHEYYIMYEYSVPVREFTVTAQTQVTEVEMYTGRYSISIQNQETSAYYTIDPIGDNTDITINNRRVGGYVTLDAGTYDIIITTIDVYEHSVTFSIEETGIIGSILMVVFSSLVAAGSFVFFIIFYILQRKQQNNDIEFDGYTYDQTDFNKLYDLNDDYFDNKE